ncbi:RNA polymerase sigma factor [Pedobacter caeni]|uniref:RNA polymerase sigma-70 factor, ECF subfamily n=1 Tax=Pedobacter caeni TaxID=288992 RepID=A0A1M4UFW0_9SPHI|nr:RNA polymerase sigma-70 factor [Pedobacter caeni]SHE55498.1 RNA polymerase sigma-70 factor, ECF subfamily [Pedobacter caeni]
MRLTNSYSDKELCELLKSNDESAFSAIYDRYWAKVYRNAMRILGCESDAEDVVQEVFESIWKRRATLEIQGALPNYLFSAARYMAIRLIEKNLEKSGHQESLSLAFSRIVMPVVESEIDTKMLQANIDHIVASLPYKMKEIFILSRAEQLSHKDIAKRLKISEQTVKKQVYYALKHIRQQLGPVPLIVVLALIYTTSEVAVLF